MTTEGAQVPVNIGPRGQRLRRRTGLVLLAFAVVLLVALGWTDAPRWWRLAAFPFLGMGLLGVLQARARTCVALAASRTCDEEIGGLTEGDADLLARRGKTISKLATTVAAGITALALIWP